MNKRIIIISAAAMLFAGVAIMSMGISKGAYPVVMFGNKNVDAYDSKKEKGTVDISEFDTLTIDCSSEDVYIEEGDEYKFEYYVKKSNIPEVNSDGKSLTIKQPESVTFFYITWDIEVGLHEKSGYKITVPKGAAPLNVDIKNSAEEIIIDGVDMNGNIVADADNVIIDNISSDNLYVKASSGKIDLNNSKFDKLKLESSSDSIIAEKCTINDLYASSSSDAIKLDDVKINTANLNALDDITIDIVGQNDYSLDLVSSTGEDVIAGENKTEGSFKTDNNSGKSITAKSDTGNIRVSFIGE